MAVSAMNESVILRPFSLLAMLLSLLLVGCGTAPAEAPPLQGATMGGSFTLTDQNGRRVSDTDFAGKYRIVYFGFTYCPDVCPVDLQIVGAGLRRFEQSDPVRAARVQPIFISVDPARDTPEALRDYVANFHPRLIGLTGSEQEVADVARAYGVFFSRSTPNEQGAYLVDHTRIIVLYGPAGEPIAIIPHDHGPEGVAAELQRWVR
jgi:protein SCO1/2